MAMFDFFLSFVLDFFGSRDAASKEEVRRRVTFFRVFVSRKEGRQDWT